MAQNPLIKRYLDAGMAFTQMTQARAEEIVKDLVSAGEAQAERAEELVSELVERSKRNTDRLLELVRQEVLDQLVALGLLSDEDRARVQAGGAPAATAAKASPATNAGAKKAAAKKSSAKKKAAAKKSSTKKAAAKKSSTKKAAKKATKKSTGS
jgi:hypothetical protein